MFILFTSRIMFKCPFGFGLLFVNNLLHVWYIISIFFLSSILLVCCLLGAGIPVSLWYPSPFYGLYLYLLKTCPFCKFYGPDDQFLLLFTLWSRQLYWLSYRFILSVDFLQPCPFMEFSMLQLCSFMDSANLFLFVGPVSVIGLHNHRL